MKALLTALTMITLLSFAAVSHADRGAKHEWNRYEAKHNPPVIVKIIFPGGDYRTFQADRHDMQYFKKRGHIKHKRPYWKRYNRRDYYRPMWRETKVKRGNWYDKYWND